MNQEKFQQLINNKEFSEKILKLQTAEEVQTAFKNEGVDISLSEIEALGSIINVGIEKNGIQNVTDKDLENIFGGIEAEKVYDILETAGVGVMFGAATPVSFLATRDAQERREPENIAAASGMAIGNLALIGLGVAGAKLVPWAYKKFKNRNTGK